jgi:hypothetical protein
MPIEVRRAGTLARPFEIKAVSDEGTFSGYGSVFGVEDWYSDVVMPGAFQRSLAEHRANGTKPLLLWQHDSRAPIGVYSTVEEDRKGLYVEGQLALDVQQGREAYSLLRMGALSGLSIGYVTRRYEVDKESDVRKLLDVDLWEISPVSFPANDKARVEAVKGLFDSPKVFERQLRDALGLTREQAKRLLAGGWSALLRDAGDAVDGSGARDALSDDGTVPPRDAGVGDREEASAVLLSLRRLAVMMDP